ncbi:MAG: nicotinate-nucleotide adenylyltransferase [Dehalococcoidia bacterium]|nr:nicotinate-nucleotide adenylyltransferase [Dehalococcoidia bacterium]
MRRGILGGTFDPVHNGHLRLAAAAMVALDLAGVWFLPAGQPWMRRGALLTSREERKKMTERAIADKPGFHLLTNELDRPGDTYTVDTLEELACDGWDADETYFILGADALARAHRWKNPRRILVLARLAVAPREGSEPDVSALEAAVPGATKRIEAVRMEPVAVSASALRARAAAGGSLRGSVPDAVADYVEETELYRRGIWVETKGVTE